MCTASPAMKYQLVTSLYHPSNLTPLVHKRRYSILSILAFFVLGYSSFSLLGLRFGWHSDSVREWGAEMSLTVALASCASRNSMADDMPCVRAKLPSLLKKWGLHSLMMALEKKQSSVEDVDLARARCHDIAHALGRSDMLMKDNMSDVLSSCTTTCASGCFHGALEGWAARGNMLLPDISSLCENSSFSEEARQACTHGIGHALVNMLGNDMARSLHYCDELEEQYRGACGSGVLMELYNPGSFAHSVASLPADHPLWCNTLPFPYYEECYHHAGLYMYSQSKSEQQAVDACKKIPLTVQGKCFGEIAKALYFIWPLSEDAIGRAKEFCATQADSVHEICVDEFMKPPM